MRNDAKKKLSKAKVLAFKKAQSVAKVAGQSLQKSLKSEDELLRENFTMLFKGIEKISGG